MGVDWPKTWTLKSLEKKHEDHDVMISDWNMGIEEEWRFDVASYIRTVAFRCF